MTAKKFQEPLTEFSGSAHGVSSLRCSCKLIFDPLCIPYEKTIPAHLHITIIFILRLALILLYVCELCNTQTGTHSLVCFGILSYLYWYMACMFV